MREVGKRRGHLWYFTLLRPSLRPPLHLPLLLLKLQSNSFPSQQQWTPVFPQRPALVWGSRQGPPSPPLTAGIPVDQPSFPQALTARAGFSSTLPPTRVPANPGLHTRTAPTKTKSHCFPLCLALLLAARLRSTAADLLCHRSRPASF